jgi:histidinol-phosphate/aromatic aminotransferase/cobyric acid decarboxylase-like protein/choline kinase
MKAIILAAGYGNRMRPLTDNVHKTLLKVGNKTIIERIVDGLVENKINKIIIVTGYRADELRSYLNNRYSKVKFEYVHNPKYMKTNNIYSVALAFNKCVIDDDIILIESDLIYEPEVIARVINSKKPNVALVDKYRSGMDGTVVNVTEGIITEVIPPHLQRNNFDFFGKYKTLNIYKFSEDFCKNEFKKLLTYYSKGFDNNCYYELILGVLIYMKRETIYAEILEGEKWAEVDDANDLRIAEYIFSPKKRSEILTRDFGGYWSYDILDFCFIRNIYFPSESMLSEMRNNLAGLMQNYGSKQEVLNTKMSYYLLCDKERVNALNGASQAYPLLKEYFRNKRILLPEPTFGEYPRAFPEAATYQDRIGVDLRDLSLKVGDNDVVVIVNPNNPTGTVIPTSKIIEMVKDNPDIIFLIDESFIEFSGQSSLIEYLEKDAMENAIVIKSLSKSLGVPGLRLGYLYSANKHFNGFINNSLPIWNMNSMAEFFLEIILKRRNELAQSFKRTIADRDEFSARLKEIKYVKKVYPSGGNYILIKMHNKWARKSVNKLLFNHGIYLKDVTSKMSASRADNNAYWRLAVRSPEDNSYFVAKVAEIAMRSS